MPTFTRTRKTSQSERFQPSLGTIKASSRGDFSSNSDVRTCENRKSRSGSLGSKYSDDFVSRHLANNTKKKQTIANFLLNFQYFFTFTTFFALVSLVNFICSMNI